MVATGESARSVFSVFDRDSDGKISVVELRLCMKAALGEDVPEEDAAELIAAADMDGDGLLSEDEFLTLVHAEVEEEERCEVLREAFRAYEMEGEGCITPLSLRRTLSRLGLHEDIEQCRAMICRFDLNGDGVLSFDEFKVMMCA